LTGHRINVITINTQYVHGGITFPREKEAGIGYWYISIAAMHINGNSPFVKMDNEVFNHMIFGGFENEI
jgi:hypothetical protein